MTFKKIFVTKSKQVSKNAEFHADFESVEKVVKKCARKVYEIYIPSHPRCRRGQVMNRY
jgi:hypothetical protein